MSAQEAAASALLTEDAAAAFRCARLMETAGVVYTETVVHMAPEQFTADAPYQIAIVTLADESRRTVRIAGERVHIGDAVEFVEDRNDIPFYRKTPLRKSA
jgi:hypothetical protein